MRKTTSIPGATFPLDWTQWFPATDVSGSPLRAKYGTSELRTLTRRANRSLLRSRSLAVTGTSGLVFWNTIACGRGENSGVSMSTCELGCAEWSPMLR